MESLPLSSVGLDSGLIPAAQFTGRHSLSLVLGALTEALDIVMPLQLPPATFKNNFFERIRFLIFTTVAKVSFIIMIFFSLLVPAAFPIILPTTTTCPA